MLKFFLSFLLQMSAYSQASLFIVPFLLLKNQSTMHWGIYVIGIFVMLIFYYSCHYIDQLSLTIENRRTNKIQEIFYISGYAFSFFFYMNCIHDIFCLYVKISPFYTALLTVCIILILILINNVITENMAFFLLLVQLIVFLIIMFLYLKTHRIILKTQSLDFSVPYYIYFSQIPLLFFSVFRINSVTIQENNLNTTANQSPFFYPCYFDYRAIINLCLQFFFYFFSKMKIAETLLTSKKNISEVFLYAFPVHFYLVQLLSILMLIIIFYVSYSLFLSIVSCIQKSIQTINDENRKMSEILVSLVLSLFFLIIIKYMQNQELVLSISMLLITLSYLFKIIFFQKTDDSMKMTVLIRVTFFISIFFIIIALFKIKFC